MNQYGECIKLIELLNFVNPDGDEMDYSDGLSEITFYCNIVRIIINANDDVCKMNTWWMRPKEIKRKILNKLYIMHKSNCKRFPCRWIEAWKKYNGILIKITNGLILL